jgi:hypothetical protein
MPRYRRGVRARAVLTAVITLAVAGTAACSADPPGRREAPLGSSVASPFAAEPCPEEFVLTWAGDGVPYQRWGDDTDGTVEPFTVLAPPGEDASGPHAVVVSVTGYEGYEGGLDQASRGFVGAGKQRFRVEGRPAIYTPRAVNGTEVERQSAAWSDLVAVRGDDLAVRVASRDATREQLLEVLAAAVPDRDRRAAPAVPEPPSDLRVLGSVNATAVSAITWGAPRNDMRSPRTATAFGFECHRGRETLDLVTVPGRAAALEALAASGVRALAARARRTARDRRSSGRDRGLGRHRVGMESTHSPAPHRVG